MLRAGPPCLAHVFPCFLSSGLCTGWCCLQRHRLSAGGSDPPPDHPMPPPGSAQGQREQDACGQVVYLQRWCLMQGSAVLMVKKRLFLTFKWTFLYFSLWPLPLVALSLCPPPDTSVRFPLHLSRLTKPTSCRLFSTTPSSKSSAWPFTALLCPCPSCTGEPSTGPAHQVCLTGAEQRGRITFPLTCWRWSS